MDDLSDNGGFSRFYDEHRPMLEGLAFRITRDRDLAQDAVANAVIRVWRRCQEEVPQSPLAYLAQAVRNAARDQVRRARSAAERERRWAQEPAVVDLESSLDDRDVLERLLPSLPDHQRLTLELRYLEDLADADIAARLGVRPVTVRTNAHRALHRLRAQLAQEPALVGASAAQPSRNT